MSSVLLSWNLSRNIFKNFMERHCLLVYHYHPVFSILSWNFVRNYSSKTSSWKGFDLYFISWYPPLHSHDIIFILTCAHASASNRHDSASLWYACKLRGPSPGENVKTSWPSDAIWHQTLVKQGPDNKDPWIDINKTSMWFESVGLMTNQGWSLLWYLGVNIGLGNGLVP